MGDHYAPLKYLRGWCPDQKTPRIWAYILEPRDWFRTALENVAQENGFYAPEVEVALNEEVEKPANPILDKLREGKAITREDRVALAVYIGTFIYRVPNHRAKLLALAPAAFDQKVREMKDLIRSEGARRGITADKIQRKLDQADAIRAQYADKIPQPVLDKFREPWPREDVVKALIDMKWRFLHATPPATYITNDNPIFFFTAFGLRRPESELSFPISSTLTLHGSWPVGSDEYVLAVPGMVEQLNRRN